MTTRNLIRTARLLVPLFLFVVAFWTIPGCGGGSSGSGSLDFEGKVLVAESGEPIPGTTVTREDTGDQAVSDENGNFVLSTEFANSILLRFQGQFERSERAEVTFDITQAVNVQDNTRISTFDALVDVDNQRVIIVNQQDLTADRTPVEKSPESGSEVDTSDSDTGSTSESSTSTTEGTTSSGGTTSSSNTSSDSTSTSSTSSGSTTSGTTTTASSSTDAGSGTSGTLDTSSSTSSGGSGSVADSAVSGTSSTSTTDSGSSGTSDSSSGSTSGSTGSCRAGVCQPTDGGDSGGSSGGTVTPIPDEETV